MGARFPAWTASVGAMLDAHQQGSKGCAVQVSCTKCRLWRPVALGELVAAKGRDWSLINRRYRCRMSPGCDGWNRFHYQSGVMRPLWTEEQGDAWAAADWQETDRVKRARRQLTNLMQGRTLRLDRAPPGVDRMLWAITTDEERAELKSQAEYDQKFRAK